MDFSYSPRTHGLRSDIRAFVARHLTDDLQPVLQAGQAGDPAFRAFHDLVLAQGWVAASWPVAYGGQGQDAETQYVIEEEFWRRGLRIGGAGTAAAQILQSGTDAQRKHYIPRIIRRDYRFAPALTEAIAGTDLAGVACQAQRTASGDYVLNGEKTYVSGVGSATHFLLVARTGTLADRARGLTVFLVDKSLPGITTHPMVTVQAEPRAPAGTVFGQSRFDRVVFEDCTIPLDCRLGDENGGWGVIANSSAHERATPRTWMTAVARTEEFAARLAAKPDRGSTEERLALGQLWAEGQAARLLAMRCLSLGRGGAGGGEAAMEGIWTAEYVIRATVQIAQLEGPSAQLLDGTAIGDGGLLAHSLLGAPQTATHHGGTRALRDQIAARCLNLKERR